MKGSEISLAMDNLTYFHNRETAEMVFFDQERYLSECATISKAAETRHVMVEKDFTRNVVYFDCLKMSGEEEMPDEEK